MTDRKRERERERAHANRFIAVVNLHLIEQNRLFVCLLAIITNMYYIVWLWFGSFGPIIKSTICVYDNCPKKRLYYYNFIIYFPFCRSMVLSCFLFVPVSYAELIRRRNKLQKPKMVTNSNFHSRHTQPNIVSQKKKKKCLCGTIRYASTRHILKFKIRTRNNLSNYFMLLLRFFFSLFWSVC